MPAPSPDDPPPARTPPRRRFIRRLALATGAAGTGVLLAGCGGSENGGGPPPADSAGTASASSENKCVPPAELSEAAREGRATYDYVGQTPRPQQRCDNCQFWQPDGAGEAPDAKCGGCQLFPGPVHPEGYCTAWLTA